METPDLEYSFREASIVVRGSSPTKLVEKKIRDFRIDSDAKFGKFIHLTCLNHPHLRWRTKNIGGNAGEKLFLQRDLIFVGNHLENNPNACECECSEDLLRLSRTHETKGFVL